MSGAASAAVAEDFADSLRDLTQNNRYEISNLTIIAKESTEHAQAISKALESHIKTVRSLPTEWMTERRLYSRSESATVIMKLTVRDRQHPPRSFPPCTCWTQS